MNSQDITTIHQALQYLAGVCDFAEKRDGQGFNAFDAAFGHSLALAPVISEMQAILARKMLVKYQAQLGNAGIVLPAKVEKSPIRITAVSGGFFVYFGGKPGPADLEIIKSIPGRRWMPNEPELPWFIPASGKVELLKAFDGRAEIEQAVYTAIETPAAAPVQPEAPAPAPGVTVTRSNGSVIIKIGKGHPDFMGVLNKIKALPERKYDPDTKCWTVPSRLIPELTKILPDADFSGEVKQVAAAMQELSQMANKASSDFDVPGLKGTLMPFQRAGVEFLEKSNGRAMIADEMGLGKTIQALGYLQLHPELRPAVLVVPASLKINWQREAAKWLSTGDRFVVLATNKAVDIEILGCSVAIINYDILQSWLEKLIAWKPALIISDESHYLKNTKAIRTKAMQKLAKIVSRVILLTGTPVTNRPQELWPLLNMLAPKDWPNFFRFANRYCDAHHNGFGWDFTGASNLPELHEAIKPYVIRREKSQVLTELPAKRRATVVLTMSTEGQREYRQAIRDARAAIEAKGGNAVELAVIEKAKQAAVRAKLPDAIKWIEDVLETGEKLIVFCTHNLTVDTLMAHFGNCAVKLTGSDNQQQRQASVDRFQTDPACTLFVGNIKAAGVGITLHAASNVAFLELDWTHGSHLQAEDRAHRIGQSQSVTAWYLVADGTIEEDIVAMLESKASVVEQITDGRDTEFGILNALAEKIMKGNDNA